MSGNKIFKVAAFSAFPIHYLTPMLRLLSSHQELDLTVYWYSSYGIHEPYVDKEFGIKEVDWGIEHLYDLKYEFLTNVSPKPTRSFWGQIHPSVLGKLNRNRYDAVFMFGYDFFTDWIVFLVAWKKRIPILFRGETNLKKKRSFLLQALKKFTVGPMLKRIDACLYSCEATAEYYRNFGVSNKDLFFCPCAVDNDRFKSYADELLPRRLELRSQYGIPNDAVVFLFTGRLVSRKRPMDIIAAFEHLKSNYRSKAWMVFVGDGIEEKKLKDYSKRRNLKNVCFMGFRDQLEISKFYSLADVFVLSSDFDPSPKSLNEAMNFSLPVIASDMVGTAPDLVCEGKNGFIYPTGNVEILSEYMGQMLSSPEMVKKMGKFSLLRVSKWNYEEDVNGVLHALRHVVHY